MPIDNAAPDVRATGLSELIAAYVEAAHNGRPLDRSDLLRRHPVLAP